MKLHYEYPHTWKLVVFSVFLSMVSLLFAVYTLNDASLILTYFLYVIFFTAFFFFLKLKIYSQRIAEAETSKQTSKKSILLLLLILIFGVSSPFLLILFVDPVTWFLIILSFIAGVNIPEIILYVIYHFGYTENSE